MQDSKNMILAVVLSIVVLVGWQFLVAGPQIERAEKQREAIEQQAESSATAGLSTPVGDGNSPVLSADIDPSVAGASQTFSSREDAIASNVRITIDTPALSGSINTVGARLDDLEMKNYRETIDKTSPIISLLSPLGGPEAYFIEQGWVTAGGSVNLPDTESEWQIEGARTLTASTPVTLTFDNGEGLTFKRTFAIDENYLFTVTQSVTNKGTGDVALYPFSRIARHGTPDVRNFFVLHEGPIGVLGDENLIEKKYSDLQDEPRIEVSSTGGWLGFTDKYWATAILPGTEKSVNALFSSEARTALNIYRASFVEQSPLVTAANATSTTTSYIYAGAKVESIIASYEEDYGFDRIELLIDWGWFHFLTKPMFKVIRWLNSVLGNFGLAILAVTVMVKALFFPLASRSYASMAAMRRVQPEMKELQAKFKDDRAAQQQATMELYKREKINPLSGCWPILIQIPVFFSLYKVLFVTIEMRHAPFFGWIHDLAAQDPTNVFNLFGLLPYDPTALPVIGGFLALGVWPVIMGITMWIQMKLNPPPPRSKPGVDFWSDANRFHLHAGHIPRRSGDLLGMEQYAVGHPAICDHETARR